jgi:hypothetical protein
MLGALPPEAMNPKSFLVGEPATHNNQGQPLFDCFYNEDGKYFYFGRMTRRTFLKLFV